MNTLTIEQVAKYLLVHKETVRRMAASGDLPGTKIGRRWVFMEDDLVMYVRNKYSSIDALQGVHYRSNEKWHSNEKMVSGGLTSHTLEKEYEKVLKLR